MASDSLHNAEFENFCDHHYIPMSDGTQLLVLTSCSLVSRDHPSLGEEENKQTLLLVPGWGSIVPSWEAFLLEAVRYFDVVYVETREKDSSLLTPSSVSHMKRFAKDIQEVILYLHLREDNLILVGSCIGGNSIAYGLKDHLFDPHLTFLIGPQLHFPLPWYARFLIPISPHWLLGVFRPILRMWVRLFKAEDKVQASKYIRVINEADSKKWKKVGKAIAFEKFDHVFPLIEQRVHVVGQTTDKMHKASDAIQIAQLIPKSTYITMESNAETHSGSMVQKIIQFHTVSLNQFH
ncbi:MAG: hypothetical protein ACTSRK_07920 [Promethearchaeota archaeon]